MDLAIRIVGDKPGFSNEVGNYKIWNAKNWLASAPSHSQHKHPVLRKERSPSSSRFTYACRVFQGAYAFLMCYDVSNKLLQGARKLPCCKSSDSPNMKVKFIRH